MMDLEKWNNMMEIDEMRNKTTEKEVYAAGLGGGKSELAADEYKSKEIDGLMTRKERKQLAEKTGTKFVGISQYRGAGEGD